MVFLIIKSHAFLYVSMIGDNFCYFFLHQETPFYGATVKVHEPVGVIGIACPDESPLLGFVSLLAPAVIRGNTVVVIPCEKYPLVAMDMYQVSKERANSEQLGQKRK